MNHDPFKINEAILDMWRDLKAGDDYINRLEIRNAELVSENARLKAEVEKLTFEPLSYLDDAGEWMPRHTHLAAVERLKAECQARQAENSVLAVECDSLKAEVEAYKPASDEVAAAFLALPAPHNQVGRVIEGIESLKAEVERLKAVSTIEQRTIQGLQQTPEWSEIARLTAECRRLEAEVERLRASSFVTAVPSEHYERVIKAGDAMAFNYEQMHNIDGVYDSDLMKFVARWNAAKEGNQS